jgi:ATP-dependent DNA helicase RecG
LPEPEFRGEGERFVTVIWRDWLTGEVLAGSGLNERQKKAMARLRTQGKIRSAEYQELMGSSRQTASRDLDELVTKGLIQRVGEGRGTHYIKARGMPRK